jgi:hypothetical protein
MEIKEKSNCSKALFASILALAMGLSIAATSAIAAGPKIEYGGTCSEHYLLPYLLGLASGAGTPVKSCLVWQCEVLQMNQHILPPGDSASPLGGAGGGEQLVNCRRVIDPNLIDELLAEGVLTVIP